MIERPQSRMVEWFRELREPLRRFLRARRGVAAADIDDVAQEVFLRLLRFDRAELITQPKAYLFRMAANVASEWSMRARERLPHDAAWLAELPADSTVAEDVQRVARDGEIAAAVQTLPGRSRRILQLHFEEGLTHEAIATRLQLTRRIVKRDLMQAYATLRLSLSDHAPQALRREREHE